MTRYKATFSPQAWQRDYAIPVDPEGDTSWDATEFVNTYGAENPAWLADTIERGSDHDDILRTDPNAPEWVREWQGPFDTYLDKIVEPMTDADAIARVEAILRERNNLPLAEEIYALGCEVASDEELNRRYLRDPDDEEATEPVEDITYKFEED